MFEKCGLRDIFVRIVKLKWLILVLVIIGAAVGSLMYVKDLNAYKAEVAENNQYEHRMYCGYAYYYLYGDITGGNTSAKRLKELASSYEKIFSLRSTSGSIYEALAGNHDQSELGALLDAERYADEAVGKYTLYHKNYGLRAISSYTLLEIRTCAETKDMCKELTKICGDKLIAIASKMKDSSVKLEGRYYRNIVVDSTFFKDTTDEETGTATTAETKEPAKPGIMTIVMWVLIGLLAGIIFAIAAAVFVPTINRDSDFEGYGIRSLGSVRKDGAPVFGRILAKIAGDGTVHRLAVVTTLKEDKKLTGFIEKLQAELKDTEVELVLVSRPAEISGAATQCTEADMIVALERRGVSRHQKFDVMAHYIELLDKKIEGAALLVQG